MIFIRLLLLGLLIQENDQIKCGTILTVRFIQTTKIDPGMSQI